MLTISKKNVVEFKKDKKFDEVFNNFRWVLTGRENSQYGKEIFQCVYIDEKNIVCTDAKMFACKIKTPHVQLNVE